MKSRILTILTVLGLGLSLSATAAEKGKGKEKDKHEHAEVKTGPTNGRLITSVEPHVEFLVTKEKKVELRFVDVANKVVAPGTQEITVTLGERAKPTKLTFTKEGDKLVSSGPVSEGNDYPTVVQIRAKSGAKPVYERFNLNLSKCPTCENAEYNCKCEHEAEKKETKGKKK